MPALRINPAATFAVPVRLTVPGVADKAVVVFTFAHKGKAALRAWTAGAQNESDAVFLGEVVKGWHGVEAPDGSDLPFSAEAFAALLDAYPAAGSEIYQAYLTAYHEARSKN